MIDHFLTILREKTSSLSEFRNASAGISRLLAAQAAAFLPLNKVKTHTPLEETEGAVLEDPIVLIPVLRSGLAMLGAFQELFAEAAIGFLGIRRDESTALPGLYYENLPKLSAKSRVIILDPMLATAGTMELALSKVHRAGARLDRSTIVSIIASREGADQIREKFPDTRLIAAATDPVLNRHKFIVPGLGDFGDRYFNT